MMGFYVSGSERHRPINRHHLDRQHIQAGYDLAEFDFSPPSRNQVKHFSVIDEAEVKLNFVHRSRLEQISHLGTTRLISEKSHNCKSIKNVGCAQFFAPPARVPGDALQGFPGLGKARQGV